MGGALVSSRLGSDGDWSIVGATKEPRGRKRGILGWENGVDSQQSRNFQGLEKGRYMDASRYLVTTELDFYLPKLRQTLTENDKESLPLIITRVPKPRYSSQRTDIYMQIHVVFISSY
jgi:hypothetical protein